MSYVDKKISNKKLIRKDIIRRMLNLLFLKTQKDLAGLMDITPSQISDFIARDDSSFYKRIVEFAQKHNKSIDWLLTGEEPSGKKTEGYGAGKLAHGKVREDQTVYNGRHEDLVTKLVEILDGPNRSNAVAIEQNVNAFHQTKDVPIPGIETGNKDTCDGGQLKKNRRNGERRSQAG